MDDRSGVELTATIKDAVIRVLDLDIGPEQLVDGVSLYSSVVHMDSLTLLHLLVTLEEELGIEIDDEDVMNANLKDVGSLVTMVRLIAESASAGSERSRAHDIGA